MFPNLEFVKTALNAITAKFQRVKYDVDAVKSDVDAVKSDVDAVKSDVDAVKSNPPDWNEPDSASHAYIKNKPCYDYIEPSGVIWESDSAGTSGQGPIMLIDLVDRWLVEGETYRLTVDGVETTYTCAADADGDGLYIGTGYADVNNGNIYQPYNSTVLRAWTNGLWNDGAKVCLEGSLRRYKKLDTSLYDAVKSVNGETGEVQITPENIGAASAGSKVINLDGRNYILKGLIDGTYDGGACSILYLGGNRYFEHTTEKGTGEECFVLGPKDTILGGIKTPINDDQAANKAYVDATIAAVEIPSVDSTLTQSGQAADAKATGDAIRSLSEEKVSLPKAEDGSVIPGTAGWYAVSDGAGGITWVEFAPSTGGGGSETVSHSIIWNLTNVTSSNNVVSVSDGSSFAAVLTPDDGYALGDVTITMGGEVITGAWNADTSTISISSVTGDVVITCTGTAQSSGEVLDTSPVIAVNNAQANRGEGTIANAYTCVTQPYKVKEVSEQVTLVYCTPWDRWNSGLNAPTIQLYLGDTYVTYWTQMVGNDAADAFVEHTQDINNNYGNCDSVRLTLWQNHIDNSYAYVKETGEILFAGANTQYYGMTNINGNIGGESAVSVAAEVDNQVAMLSLSTGETADTAAYSGLSSDYVAMVQANYDAMMAECLGDYNKIPLIVHTDQHGRIGASNQVMKLIGDMVNWYEVSKCINLGDTVSDRFGTSELENYLSATKDSIPLSKRLDIYGNHDVWDSDDSQKYTVDQKRLSPYFKNIYARRHGNNGYFTVVDDYYNVKYLVISDLEYPDTNDSTRRITTAQAKFIVSELSEDDGRDVVLVSHVPLDSDEVTSRDSTYLAYSEKFLSDTTAHNSFMEMIAARKNHTSGTFTDSEGISHAYDFSNVSGDLLMSLHGHAHFEAYRTFENSITEFIFDWFDGNTFYFAYIDREEKKFKAWKNEADVEALEISIA